MGEIGNQDTTLRSEYCVKAMAAAGFNPDELGRDTAMWDKVIATNKMEGFISSAGIENIEAVLSNNDDMALGAIEAFKANGYNSGDPSRFIPVVGLDATEAALESMKKRELYASVKADADKMGDACIKVVVAAANGIAVDKAGIGYDVSDGKYVWIPHTTITFND